MISDKDGQTQRKRVVRRVERGADVWGWKAACVSAVLALAVAPVWAAQQSTRDQRFETVVPPSSVSSSKSKPAAQGASGSQTGSSKKAAKPTTSAQTGSKSGGAKAAVASPKKSQASSSGKRSTGGTGGSGTSGDGTVGTSTGGTTGGLTGNATGGSGTGGSEGGTSGAMGQGGTTGGHAHAKAESKEKATDAQVTTMKPSQLAGFENLAPEVQRMLTVALRLTTNNLTYTFGSADPAKGGMDCSGAVFYVLQQLGVAGVPRSSAGMYQWVREKDVFEPVFGSTLDSFEFADLRPGDLLFWTGTYDSKRDPNVSHVMIYLGKEKGTGRRVMFGASDGRTYDGEPQRGVSVFDFRMPRAESKSRFIGYAPIPGLGGAPMANK